METLIKHAKDAMKNAYIPYSKFAVGAAILLKDGTIIKGSNIENASYGLSNCAERSALFSLYSQGYKKEDIVAMAVIGKTSKPIYLVELVSKLLMSLSLKTCQYIWLM